MKQKNILIVDDEQKILEVIASFLESQNYQVFQAENGAKAFEIFEKENISLIILDLMLPDLSGEEICKKIRRTSRVPIIMLTAKVEESDVLEGLEIGADDYITKPFSLKELIARVKAVLRRTSEEPVPLFNKNSYNGGDFGKDLVLKDQIPVNLTPTEFNILTTLIKFPGKVFTREELIEFALGSGFEGFDRAVDSHIKNLRQKIEDNPRSPKYVLTIHGKGYKFGGE